MSNFKDKMHQIRFRLGLRTRPRWGGGLQRSPNSLAGFKWPTSKVREGSGKERGEEGKKRGGEGKSKEKREKLCNFRDSSEYAELSFKVFYSPWTLEIKVQNIEYSLKEKQNNIYSMRNRQVGNLKILKLSCRPCISTFWLVCISKYHNKHAYTYMANMVQWR